MKFLLIPILLIFSAYANSACCIKESDLRIRVYGEKPGEPHVDTSLGWGHAFDLYYDLENRRDLSGGECRLEWWEESDYIVPGLQGLGIVENKWFDHKVLNPLSPMWESWNKGIKMLENQTETRIRVTDYPALGLTGIRSVETENGVQWIRDSQERNLKIKVKVKSGSTECKIQEESFSLSQYLNIQAGRPNGGYLELENDFAFD